MQTQNVVNYINSNNLIGLKAGKDRKEFLEIWMVTVDNRIFARSWGFAEKSWYNTFLKENKGQIKCGENVYEIKAEIPHDLDRIEQQINDAYLKKYDSGENSYYAQGIIKKEHVEKTMEFILL